MSHSCRDPPRPTLVSGPMPALGQVALERMTVIGPPSSGRPRMQVPLPVQRMGAVCPAPAAGSLRAPCGSPCGSPCGLPPGGGMRAGSSGGVVVRSTLRMAGLWGGPVDASCPRASVDDRVPAMRSVATRSSPRGQARHQIADHQIQRREDLGEVRLERPQRTKCSVPSPHASDGGRAGACRACPCQAEAFEQGEIEQG